MGIGEKKLILQGKILAELNKNKKSLNIQDYEFGVFSQWGEDGIIQFLIDKIQIKNKVFVEFGVENYQESNTRFLLQNNNWSGLVIDGSKENVDFIKSGELYWRHSLTAVTEFITKDNINKIITENGISGDIGILSVDIDGNDYWVLKNIECVNPVIIIVEYNSLFGKELLITVPYDENFDRMKKHFSGLYWGASISALTKIAKEKGYSLIGSNSEGVNLFFVRDELVGDLKVMTPQDAYVESKLRQSRDEGGSLTYLDNRAGLELIKEMNVYSVLDNKEHKIKDLKNVA